MARHEAWMTRVPVFPVSSERRHARVAIEVEDLLRHGQVQRFDGKS
jgi:hypothetical protein